MNIRTKQSLKNFIDDLFLLASVCFAQVIVHRTLHRHKKERERRLKMIRLVTGVTK
jgi:hypothetical protein